MVLNLVTENFRQSSKAREKQVRRQREKEMETCVPYFIDEMLHYINKITWD